MTKEYTSNRISSLEQLTELFQDGTPRMLRYALILQHFGINSGMDIFEKYQALSDEEKTLYHLRGGFEEEFITRKETE
jgi:hypothetical protein